MTMGGAEAANDRIRAQSYEDEATSVAIAPAGVAVAAVAATEGDVAPAVSVRTFAEWRAEMDERQAVESRVASMMDRVRQLPTSRAGVFLRVGLELLDALEGTCRTMVEPLRFSASLDSPPITLID